MEGGRERGRDGMIKNGQMIEKGLGRSCDHLRLMNTWILELAGVQFVSGVLLPSGARC